MKFILILALAVFLGSCTPTDRIVTEIPSYAGVYARVTIEGADSIEVLTQLAISTREKSANHGFVFRAFNQSSTSINALWIKIGGQSAQTYFRADEIRINDPKNRVVMSVLSDPNPPPLTNIFNQSLRVLLEDLADRLKLPLSQFKVELK